MATLTVRELSYAYIVEWGEREAAVVIIQDETERAYLCLRCHEHGCDHGKAVIRHVNGREGA